jgi:exodeoxyribonuclease VII small subunit
MSDERSAFETTRARLEDIVSQVRRRDVTLEQSLDLLDEAVRLVNECNDLIDQTSFRAGAAADVSVPVSGTAPSTAESAPADDGAPEHGLGDEPASPGETLDDARE